MTSPRSIREQAKPVDQAEAGLWNQGPYRAYWYTLVVVLIYELACGMDLGQVSVLVKPIEQTYGIGDTAFAAVAVSSASMGGIFVYYLGGILADTYNRRNLLVLSGSIWTLAALSVAVAAHPWQLFAVRFIGGFGMSIGGASIFHILVDSFSRDRRTIAISLFGVGVAAGTGAGLAACGAIFKFSERIGTVVVPVVGPILPWQLCFVFIALLGAIIVGLILTLREPTRLDRQFSIEAANVVTSLKAFLVYMRRHGRLWFLFLTGNFIFGALFTAILTWQPTLASRVYHVPIATAAAVLGTLTAVLSIAGRLIGGSVAQWLVNTGRSYTLPKLFPYFPGFAVLFAFAFPLVPSYYQSVILMAVAMLLNAILGAFQVNAVQDTAPNEVRGQIVGVFSFFGFISTVIGTVGIAFVSDRFFGGGSGLTYSFALIGPICAVAATILLVYCIQPYITARKDMERSVTTGVSTPDLPLEPALASELTL